MLVKTKTNNVSSIQSLIIRIHNMKKTIWFCAIILGISGCSGYQHAPIPQYVVDDCNKGVISANYSLKTLQLGYCPKDNLSLFAYGYYHETDGAFLTGMVNTNDPNKSIYKSKERQISVGAGNYFKDKDLGDGQFVHYGLQYGLGMGDLYYNRISEYRDYPDMEMNTNHMNLFIQPVIGTKGKWYTACISSMLEYKYYYHIKATAYPSGIANVDYISSDKTFMNHKQVHGIFYEPSLIIKMGSENVKFQAQGVACFNLSPYSIKTKETAIYFSIYLSFDLLK